MSGLNDIISKIGGAITGVTGSISDAIKPKAVVPVQTPIKKYYLKDRGIEITDDELNSLRPIIYGEVSNRDINKKKLEANVIVNTILNRAKEYALRGTPKKLSEIVAMPNQYQAYGGNQYKQYASPTDVVALQKKREVDSILDEIYNQIKSDKYQDFTKGAVFYTHKPTGEIIYNREKLFK